MTDPVTWEWAIEVDIPRLSAFILRQPFTSMPSPPQVSHRLNGIATIVAVDLDAGVVALKWHKTGATSTVDNPALLRNLAAHRETYGWPLPAPVGAV